MYLKQPFETHDHRREGGFTLVEVMAAFLILSILMLALITTTIAGYRATREARFLQQATAVGNERLEEIRDLGFRTAAHTSLPGPAAHPGIGTAAGCATGSQFDPDFRNPTTLACEDLIVRSASSFPTSVGTVSSPTTTRTIDGKLFTVTTLLTWVAGSGGSNANQEPVPAGAQKRVYIEVSWDSNGAIDRYSNSTILSQYRRGIPRARFSFRADQQQTVTPGTTVTFPHTIENFGPTDTYDLAAQPGPHTTRGWTFSYYKDVNNNQAVDVGTDTLLTDTNGNATVDTGPVPTGTFPLLIQWTASGGITSGTGITVRFAATSSVTGQVRVVNDQLIVQNTALTLYLHNRHRPEAAGAGSPPLCPASTTPPSGHTTRCTPTMFMAPDPTPQAADFAAARYRYSSDLYASDSGRFITRGNVDATTTDTAKSANWTYQVATTTSQPLSFSTATLYVWVAADGMQCDEEVNFTAYLRTKTAYDTTTGVVVAQGSGLKEEIPGAVDGTCGFQLEQVTLSPLVAGSTIEIPLNAYLELKVVVRSAGGGDDGLFDYDFWPADNLVPTGTQEAIDQAKRQRLSRLTLQ